VRVDVRPHRGRPADPRADLVTGHEALDQPPAVEATLLRDGERPGHDVDRGVAAAEPAALVDLERDAGSCVRQRGPERVGLGAVAEQRRRAMGRTRGGESRELAVLGQCAAGDDGAERVEQHELGGGHRGGGEPVEARRGHERREAVQIVRRA